MPTHTPDPPRDNASKVPPTITLALDEIWASFRLTLKDLEHENFGSASVTANATSEARPQLSHETYMRAYSDVFQLCTGSRSAVTEIEIIQYLEDYLSGVSKTALNALLSRAKDPRAALSSYLLAYEQFYSCLFRMNRLLAYVDRHVYRRASDEGRSWFAWPEPPVQTVGASLDPVAGQVAQPMDLSGQARKKRVELVNCWELDSNVEQGSAPYLEADLRAQAGSNPDTVPIVSIMGMGLRRWRIGVAQPLLAIGTVAEYLTDLGELPETMLDVLKINNSLKSIGVRAHNPTRLIFSTHLSVATSTKEGDEGGKAAPTLS
jgi:hypothetical protein